MLALFLAVTIGLVLTPGLGLFAIIPLVAMLGVGAWLVVSLMSRTSPGEAVRRTPRHHRLLGPGGADDPDRGR